MSKYGLDPWIEGYLDYLRNVKRNAHRSVVDARCTLKKVSLFMDKHRPGVPLWKLSLDDYLAWLSHAREHGTSDGSLRKDLCHVRGLLNYAWRAGRADRNVLDGFRIQSASQRRPPRVLSIPEAERLVHAFAKRNREERRRRLVVLLLYGCGLRSFELCSLDVQDINTERQEVLVKRGKGGRQRYIPVPSGVWTELLAYMTERGGKRGPLFRTAHKSVRIRTSDVGEIVREAAERVGLENVTPRVLRHSFATHLMDRGVDLPIIASLMGHRSVNETGIYLHALAGRKKEASSRLDLLEEE
jgi:integrase/recombinase XerD